MRGLLPWQRQEPLPSFCQLQLTSYGINTHKYTHTDNNCELSNTLSVFRLPQPRARDMLEAGVIVALGSDFNPNAYCCSMVSV